MMFLDLKKNPSSVFNDPCSNTNQMESQGLQASRSPGLRQGFAFHHREDVIGHRIESPPGSIGKEAFRRQHASGQIILKNIMNLFYCSTSFSLSLEQPLPSQLHMLVTTAK
jgi:hypothetical protein